MKWADFLDIGGFHPIILPHYWSDLEFTIRAYKKGYRLLTTPELTLSYNIDQIDPPIDYSSFSGFRRSLFSIQQNYNQIYQISFIFLAVPVKWIPRNLLKVIYTILLINFRYLNRKLKAIITSLKIKQDIKK